MTTGKRWTVHDRSGNEIYLTWERWAHIIDQINHSEMASCEGQLKETIRFGHRKQEPLNPRKYRYIRAFDNLTAENTHIVAIVLFRFRNGQNGGEPIPNNYIITAFQKEIG